MCRDIYLKEKKCSQYIFFRTRVINFANAEAYTDYFELFHQNLINKPKRNARKYRHKLLRLSPNFKKRLVFLAFAICQSVKKKDTNERRKRGHKDICLKDNSNYEII